MIGGNTDRIDGRNVSDRTLIAIARTTAGLAICASLTSTVIYLALAPEQFFGDWALHNALGGVILAVFGVLLVAARPRNRLAWLFPWMALWQSLTVLGGGLILVAARQLSLSDQSTALDPADFGTAGAAGNLLAAAAWILGIAPLVSLAILWFPDGRAPSPRWRPVGWLGIGSAAALTAVFAWEARPNGGAFHDDIEFGLLATVCVGGLVASVVLSVLALVGRYRRSNAAERRRFRWVEWGAGVAATLWLGAVIADLVLQSSQQAVFKAVSFPGFLVFVTGYGLAIWRHHLFDIDALISRTALVGSLAAFIGMVYVLVVYGVGTLIGRSSDDDQTLALAATAVVAFLFQPVRRRLEHLVNLLVYGRRATPYEVLSDLSGRLAEAEATAGVLPRMVALLAETTAADQAVIWRRSTNGHERYEPSRYEPLAVWPTDHDVEPLPEAPTDGPGCSVALIERSGEQLGAVTVSKRHGEYLTPIEHRLLQDLAGSAGLVLDRARLDTALRDQAEALSRSRRRLVGAQNEERLRLERQLANTHGRLEGLADGLEAAASLADEDSQQATGQQLLALADEIRLADRDIAALARGMYPPVLETQGLGQAVESLAAGLPIPVTVRSSLVGRRDRHIEQAVYFTIAEALTNVVKHAEASSATLELDSADGLLSFRVADDGIGFGPDLDLGASTGLVGLRDRIDTVGGTLTVESRPGHGTTIAGHVPLPDRLAGGSFRSATASTVSLVGGGLP